MNQKLTHVSKKKVDAVKELSKLLREKRTIMVASIKNIPASQFQKISKKLREKAVIKVPKKSIINRVIESSKDNELKQLKKKVGDSVAIIFSDQDPFDLASDLLESKSSAKAKPGQIAPKDIELPAGPTDLPPGPAISELGALGVQVQMEKGKISIKQAKVIAKEGENISKGAAEMMGKLEIMPFRVGFIPLSAFDNQEKKVYLEMNIDKEGTIESLKESFSKALALAVEISYSSKDTLGFLLGKAAAQEAKLTRVVTGEPEVVAPAPSAEEPQQEVKEEKKEEPANAAEGLASLFG